MQTDDGRLQFDRDRFIRQFFEQLLARIANESGAPPIEPWRVKLIPEVEIDEEHVIGKCNIRRLKNGVKQNQLVKTQSVW
jgi:hypothetical protein